jgi:hypothetical protein
MVKNEGRGQIILQGEWYGNEPRHNQSRFVHDISPRTAYFDSARAVLDSVLARTGCDNNPDKKNKTKS